MPRFALLSTACIGLIIIAAIAACGGDGGRLAPGEISTKFRAAAQEAAQAALLTLDDLPPGWTSAPPEEEEAPDLQLSEECDRFFEQEQLPGEVASADSNDFTGPDDQEVSCVATVFAAENAAQDALDSVKEGLSLCRDELVDAFDRLVRQGFQEGGGDPDLLEEVDISFQDLSFPRLGDASLAFRISADIRALGLPFDFTGDIIGIREGRTVDGLFYFVVGRLDIEEEQRLAEVVADKLVKANASLPD